MPAAILAPKFRLNTIVRIVEIAPIHVAGDPVSKRGTT